MGRSKFKDARTLYRRSIAEHLRQLATRERRYPLDKLGITRQALRDELKRTLERSDE
jgi:hypothetical protein